MKIALLPGGFKPPHRGHLDLIRHYSTVADKVIVFVSGKPREGPRLGTKFKGGPTMELLELYLERADLTNVELRLASYASLTHYLKNIGPDDQIILAASNKDNDGQRFHRQVRQGLSQGQLLRPEDFLFPAGKSPLRATHFRGAIEMGKSIDTYLPQGVSAEEVCAVYGLTPGQRRYRWPKR